MMEPHRSDRRAPETPKNRLFRLAFHFVSLYEIPYQFFIALLILEFIQILHFILHPSYDFQPSDEALSKVQTLLGYTCLSSVYAVSSLTTVLLGSFFLVILGAAVAISFHFIFSKDTKLVTELSSLA